MKQNALDFVVQYPQASKVVESSLYVADGLTGADSIQEAIELQDNFKISSLGVASFYGSGIPVNPIC